MPAPTATRNVNRPSKQDLLASVGTSLPDVIAPGLRLLFCGVNPGLYSAYTGYHYARPGNRFWSALYASGFVGKRVLPMQQEQLLGIGIGLTNLVDCASASARGLKRDELEMGAERLRLKIELLRPRAVAILGIGAYRRAFGATDAEIGRQMPGLGPAPLWVLPNPSGVNAHFPLPKLTKIFRQLRHDLEKLYIWP
jgi:TDG/mug DNA glycosylase family protein